MARSYANIQPQFDTFGTWVSKTNQLFSDMSVFVVTVDYTTGGAITTGNATVNGYFSANGLYTIQGIRGGNTTVTANLNFNSSVYSINTAAFSSLYASNLLTIGNTTVNTYANSTHFFSGNATYYGFGNSVGEYVVTPTSTLSMTGNSFTIFVNAGAGAPGYISVGNSSVNATMNSTSFSGIAASALSVTGGINVTVNGDFTGYASPGANTLTIIANTIPSLTAGVYGSATLTPVIAVDAKGRVTNVFTVSTSGGGGGGGTTTNSLQFSNGSLITATFNGSSAVTVNSISVGAYPLYSNPYGYSNSTSGTASNSTQLGGQNASYYYPASNPLGFTNSTNMGTYGLQGSGVSSGTYGSASLTPVITVGSDGRITSLATVSTAGSGGGSGNTSYSLTFNSSGSGGASPQAFNGGTALTISWNTIGAYPIGSNPLGYANSSSGTASNASALGGTAASGYYLVSNPLGFANSSSGTASNASALGGNGPSYYYAASNPSGYISSITSGNVTSALGYTPYNGGSNPLGFANSSSGTASNASNLGGTPASGYYLSSNPSGYITGSGTAYNISQYPLNQSVASSATPTFNGLTVGSTISGSVSGTAYNITAYTINQSLGTGNSPTFANITTTSQVIASGAQNSGIGTSTGSLGGVMVEASTGSGYAAFMSFLRPSAYGAYFGIDTDNQWKVGGWSMGATAYVLLHSGNYNSYAPTLGGSGASGTWGINITGNAATATNGLTTGNYNSYAPTLTGGNASGTWGINISGTASNISSYTINQSVGSGNAPTFAGLTINGAITATGDITAFYSSDLRLKTNIKPIKNALFKVTKLSGVTYNWNSLAVNKDLTVTEPGVIAQQVRDVLPEAVVERDDGYLAVRYEKLVPLLIEAIKELKTELDEVKARLP